MLTEDEQAAGIDTVGGLASTLAERIPTRGKVVSQPSRLESRILGAAGVQQVGRVACSAESARLGHSVPGFKVTILSAATNNTMDEQAAWLKLVLGFDVTAHEDGPEPPPSEPDPYPPASSTERPPPEGQLKRMVALGKVHYSQGGVSESLKDGTAIADVAASMRAKGWDRTKPNPDMVQMDDGTVTTLDHRRLVAATQAGLTEVPATVHAADQPLPPAEAARFRLRFPFTDPDTGAAYPRGAQPTTWGEAVRFRSAWQRDLGYPSFPLKGSPDLPVMEHHGGAG